MDIDQADAIAKLQETIKNVRIAMLTTAGTDGSLVARPMAVQDAAFDGDVWFFTRDDSDKSQQVLDNPQVNVAFVDTKANRYVSLTGRGELIHDRAQIDRLWSPAFEAYFPDGKDDPHLALLRVHAESVAWWDGPASRLGQVFGLVKAFVTKDPGAMGEHGVARV